MRREVSTRTLNKNCLRQKIVNEISEFHFNLIHFLKDVKRKLLSLSSTLILI